MVARALAQRIAGAAGRQQAGGRRRSSLQWAPRAPDATRCARGLVRGAHACDSVAIRGRSPLRPAPRPRSSRSRSRTIARPVRAPLSATPGPRPRPGRRGRSPRRSAAVPGWWRSAARTASRRASAGTTHEAAAHVEDLPHLRVARRRRARCDRARTPAAPAAARRSRSRRSAFSRSRFSSPPPVMCARPCTGDVAAQQLEHRAHVDHGRLEQRVGDARAAQLGRASRRAPSGSSTRARERVAVGVQAASTAGRSARRRARTPRR